LEGFINERGLNTREFSLWTLKEPGWDFTQFPINPTYWNLKKEGQGKTFGGLKGERPTFPYFWLLRKGLALRETFSGREKTL